MERFYSQATGSTYLAGIHTEIPDDAKPITEERFNTVISNPVKGKVRSHDADGLPILIDPPEPPAEERERAWRDTELVRINWLRERHRDEQDMGSGTTLTDEQFRELLFYVQALRDWPQSPDFPDADRRPVTPEWIANQVVQEDSPAQ